MPSLSAILEEKCLSLIYTKLGYDLVLILVMGKLRLRVLGKVLTGPASDILDYDPSGRKIRVFRGLGVVVLGVWKGDIQRVVPGLKEGKG